MKNRFGQQNRTWRQRLFVGYTSRMPIVIKTDGRAGFTLIELLMVCAVVAILAASGAVAWTAVAKRSKVQGTLVVVQAVATAIERHPQRHLALPTASVHGTRLVPMWDLNQDGWLDADPADDPVAPRDAGQREFTAAQRTAAAAINYRGLLVGVPDLALPRRHIGADGRILDIWKRPLRIAWAAAGPTGIIDGRFAGREVGVWSIGPDDVDQNGLGDDITSWK